MWIHENVSPPEILSTATDSPPVASYDHSHVKSCSSRCPAAATSFSSTNVFFPSEGHAILRESDSVFFRSELNFFRHICSHHLRTTHSENGRNTLAPWMLYFSQSEKRLLQWTRAFVIHRRSVLLFKLVAEPQEVLKRFIPQNKKRCQMIVIFRKYWNSELTKVITLLRSHFNLLYFCFCFASPIKSSVLIN